MNHSDTASAEAGAKHDPITDPLDERAEYARLAALSPAQYERERETAAAKLGMRVGSLDNAVKKARKGDRPCQGQAIEFDEIAPWHQVVDGAEMLNAIAALIRSYSVMEPWQADAVALWIVHVHTIEVWSVTPRLGLSAPTKGCGKTQTLQVIRLLVPRPYMCVMVTEATLFRIIEAHAPTLMVDELDNGLSVEGKGAILAVMNAGHERNFLVPRCVGEDYEVRGFATFGAMVYAMIGRPPGTFESRTIPIELRRATKAEWQQLKSLEEMDTDPQFDKLARQAARWAKDNLAKLKTAKPSLSGVANRDANNWKPLVAIADLVDGGWGERARKAADHILSFEANGSYGEMVLADIKSILDTSTLSEFPSAKLVRELADLPGRPWAEFGRQQKPITQTALAQLLKPFKIASDKIGPKHNRLNGYHRQQFVDAFERYLSTPPRPNRTPGQKPIDVEQVRDSKPDTLGISVRLQTSNKPSNDGTVSGCPVAKGGCEEEDLWADLDIPASLRRSTRGRQNEGRGTA